MTSERKKLGILFGGKSAEHDVSLVSAKNVMEAVDQEKYEVIAIKISKEGKWELDGEEVVLPPASKGTLYKLSNGEELLKLNVVFPVLHGPNGEDGTVQGLLQLAEVPFVGAGVLGAAVGMDKEVMKRLLKEAGLPVGKYITLKAHEPTPGFEEAKNELGLPMFVKPANMGSAVGVSKVKDESSFKAAIEDAFKYDKKILIETGIDGREIECSVMGNENPKVSVPGEIVVHDEFYSYDAKYVDDKASDLEIPAKLEEEVSDKIRSIALKAYQALECEGLGRVDSFLTKEGDIFVNEINTIPGFTQISMYPKLWEASGTSYSQLIDELIELAIERFASRRA